MVLLGVDRELDKVVDHRRVYLNASQLVDPLCRITPNQDIVCEQVSSTLCGLRLT